MNENMNQANEPQAETKGMEGAEGAAPPAGTADNPVVIEVKNPTKEEMEALRAHVEANYDFNVTVKPAKFHFKKTKDKDTGLVTDRRPVELAIPYPSVEGLLAIIETGGPQLGLLMEAMEDVVNSAARDLLYEDTSLSATNFPYDKLSWEAISSIPKTTRRGGGIPKETWEEFAADYITVMPTATGKTVEQVTYAAKLLQGKLSQVKTNRPVLELLQGQLAIYIDKSPNAEEFQDCVEFLASKCESLLNVSPAELLANL